MNRDPDKGQHPFEVCVFGETVQELRQKVLEFLKKNRPSYFDNYFGDHVAGYQIYAYSDGKMRPPVEWKLDRELFQEDKGWWYYPRQLVSGSLKRDDSTPFPFYLGSFQDASLKFVTSALIPRKGPDYQSRAMVENQLHLPLLETVLREAEEYRLNDLLQRGWHILALEYQGEVNKTGELMNRKAHFVLGHADLPAARYTLGLRDVYYYHAYSRRPGEQL